MSSNGFEMVRSSTTELFVKQYKYDNHALPNTAVLWRCDDQISFQSGGTVTEWHGSFDERFGCIVLKFNARGPDFPLRSAVLYLTDRENQVWVGVDYQGRNVTMTQEGFARFDQIRQEWAWL